MGAPCLSAPRSRSPAEQGAAIRKRVPILGRCFESSNSRNSCAPSALDIEVRKLSSPDRMMSQITPDDFRGENWIDALTIHGSLRDLFFDRSIYEAEKHLKDKKYFAPS